jgi:hypothetical protein
MSDAYSWSPDKGYQYNADDADPADMVARMRRRAEDTLYGRPPTVRMVEGGYYWIETRTGWVVAKYEGGYFYEPGKDHSATPLAISGPLTPPPNNTTKP